MNRKKCTKQHHKNIHTQQAARTTKRRQIFIRKSSYTKIIKKTFCKKKELKRMRLKLIYEEEFSYFTHKGEFLIIFIKKLEKKQR